MQEEGCFQSSAGGHSSKELWCLNLICQSWAVRNHRKLRSTFRIWKWAQCRSVWWPFLVVNGLKRVKTRCGFPHLSAGWSDLCVAHGEHLGAPFISTVVSGPHTSQWTYIIDRTHIFMELNLNVFSLNVSLGSSKNKGEEKVWVLCVSRFSCIYRYPSMVKQLGALKSSSADLILFINLSTSARVLSKLLRALTTNTCIICPGNHNRTRFAWWSWNIQIFKQCSQEMVSSSSLHDYKSFFVNLSSFSLIYYSKQWTDFSFALKKKIQV